MLIVPENSGLCFACGLGNFCGGEVHENAPLEFGSKKACRQPNILRAALTMWECKRKEVREKFSRAERCGQSQRVYPNTDRGRVCDSAAAGPYGSLVGGGSSEAAGGEKGGWSTEAEYGTPCDDISSGNKSEALSVAVHSSALIAVQIYCSKCSCPVGSVL
jgi:hypothetical protein